MKIMVIIKIIFQEGVENEDKFNFMTLKLGFYNIPGQNGDLLKFTICQTLTFCYLGKGLKHCIPSFVDFNI